MNSSAPSLHRVAFLGNHPPRVCGLATFTGDLRAAVAGVASETTCFTLAMTDAAGPYGYPPEVWLEIPESDAGAYRRAADFLHDTNTDVLCLQHEYGIYGGKDGEFLLPLLERARLPVVTTLHTVLERPTTGQRRVMGEIVARSTRLVVMTQRSREIMANLYGVAPDRLAVVPHGIPDVPLAAPARHGRALVAEGRTVLLTFGLLSPNKGIEHAIRALPEIVARRPDVLYVVLGATHPNLIRREGEAYRASLVRLAESLGVAAHVRFEDRFVDLPSLTRAVVDADIYLTPYLNEAQSVSGTLSYSFGMGKPVISTPYWHAAELLADGRGVLVPFADSGAIAESVLGLLDNPARMQAMGAAAYRLGRELIWPRVGERYLRIFREARQATTAARSAQPAAAALVVRPPPVPVGERYGELPPLRFDHLERLLDSTGIAQHAIHGVVDRGHGYCLDDNARGLILAALLPRAGAAGGTALTEALFASTAAFVLHAWNGETGRFRNFMGYDRRWLEPAGSEDSHGRAVWALGCVIRRAEEPWHRGWACPLLERSIEPVQHFTAPRAVAFALLGVVDYLATQPNDRRFVALRDLLADRLLDLLRMNRLLDWRWFEDMLSYDNARLPQALIAAGRQALRADWQEEALDALKWLCAVQTTAAGNFRPIGSDGFWHRDGERADFDQQPLEAGATVGACLEAWRATRNLRWLGEARRAFGWFLGFNDLGLPVYDATTGGCQDGLLCDRVNGNQGGESTLAYFLATVELRAAMADASLTSIQEAGKTIADTSG